MLVNKYIIVVAASAWYWRGVQALLNSFWHYHKGMDVGVYLLDYDLGAYLEGVKWPFDLEIVPLEQDDRGKTPICMLDRYLFASKLDSLVMLVDADYFFLGSMKPYFDLASQGYIIGACNVRHAIFRGDGVIEKGEGIESILFPAYPPVGIEDIAGKVNYKTIGLPLIMDMSMYGYVCKDVWDNWHQQRKDGGQYTKEWILLNAYLLHHNLLDYVVPLPAQQVSNLQQMTLRVGLIEYEGRLFTQDGLEILMMHDKWWARGFIREMKESGEYWYSGDTERINRWEEEVDILEERFRRFVKC